MKMQNKFLVASIIINVIFILMGNFIFAQEDFNKEREKQMSEIDNILREEKVNKIQKLKEKLEHNDPSVRGESAKAIAKTKDKNAYNELISLLKSEDDNIRWGAIEGLAELKDKRVAGELIKLLSHKDKVTRWKAVEALGSFKGDNVVNALLKTAKDESEYIYVREAAINSIVKIGDKKAISELEKLENSKEKEVFFLSKKAIEILINKK